AKARRREARLSGGATSPVSPPWAVPKKANHESTNHERRARPAENALRGVANGTETGQPGKARARGELCNGCRRGRAGALGQGRQPAIGRAIRPPTRPFCAETCQNRAGTCQVADSGDGDATL